MFTDLKPYPEYRDSGQPWFGPIPSSWQARGARTLFTEVTNVGHDDEDMLSVTIGRGIIRQSELINGTSKKDSSNLDKSRYKLVEPGDIAYNKMRAWQGAVGLSQHKGIVSPAYIVMRPRAGSGIYFHHLLRTPGFAKEAERWSYGITSDQWSLRSEHFKMIYLPFPPEGEQAAIMKYLGHANARIDRAIAAKRKLIALLEEQKQAIINQAVTRGLDPTVPLKDSGIPWFGQIPAHWQVRKLRSLFRRQGSGTTPPDEGDYGGGVPWVMSGDLNDTIILTTKRTITSAALRRVSSLNLYPHGSLVVAMYGATIGKTGMMETAAATNQACCVFYEPSADVDTRFAQFAVRTGKPGLLVAAFGGGQPNVNAEVVKQLRLPVPPLDEQILIATHLDRSGGQFTVGTDRLLRQIELLREFRTRLTADVVTGQLDIRDAAARLPELDLADLVSDVGTDEDDLDAELAESLEEVDA